MPQPRVGVAVFCWRNDKFLMQLRTKDRAWSVPGGRIEYGETPHACGIRETYEETGLFVVTRPGVMAVTTDLHSGDHWVTLWINADTPYGSPHPSKEAEQFRWSYWDDLPVPLWKPFWGNVGSMRCLAS